MRKIAITAWVTLDGVFDADLMDQWFYPFETEARGETIKEGVLAAGAFLMGRVTYEMLASYWPNQKHNEFGIADKLNNAPKYIVSSTLQKAGWNNSTIINDNVVAEVTRLKQQPGQELLIMGSAILAQSLLEAGLIDEYRFLVHPIIMGSGKRFFKAEMPTTKLKLVETKMLNLGVTLLRYQKKR